MVYRQTQKPTRTMEKSNVVPWYVRWFVRPFNKLTVLSTEEPISVQDAWGRIWFERRLGFWVSTNHPFKITDVEVCNRFVAAIVATRASLGSKIFFEEKS